MTRLTFEADCNSLLFFSHRDNIELEGEINSFRELPFCLLKERTDFHGEMDKMKGSSSRLGQVGTSWGKFGQVGASWDNFLWESCYSQTS